MSFLAEISRYIFFWFGIKTNSRAGKSDNFFFFFENIIQVDYIHLLGVSEDVRVRFSFPQLFTVILAGQAVPSG